MTHDAPRTLIILKPAGGDNYALAVDRVHDHEELVVKPAAPAIMATGLYAGTTLADNGRPILLLDAAGVALAGGIVPDAAAQHAVAAQAPAPAEEAAKALLFRGLDGVRRAVRLAVIDRIEEVAANCVCFSAGRLRVQLGERIIDLAGCDGHTFGSKLRLFRMSDGDAELAYGFSDVVDIIPFEGPIAPAISAGPIAGVTLLAGEQVEVIDPYFMFAANGTGSVSSTDAAPLCILPSDDPWMDNMLRPLVEAAGYRVILGGDEEQAERAAVIFRNVEASVPTYTTDDRTILLRTGAPRGPNDDSLHRYDRAGLVGALAARATAGGRR